MHIILTSIQKFIIKKVAIWLYAKLVKLCKLHICAVQLLHITSSKQMISSLSMK